jgi:putative radical SAM enzyme (TIGR03279 family)
MGRRECRVVCIKKSSGSEEVILIEKDYDEILGVDFQTAVFDGVRHCKNNCLFCFVDQMTPGMRASLYEKDDDYRLSFLQGNFITLTNLTEEDKKRIIEQRLSPLYVSVQSADEENRKLMLKNPQAVRIINDLQEMAAAGIEFHTQIVLCKNINDGDLLSIQLRNWSL